jgi:FkbM family methyltransferase
MAEPDAATRLLEDEHGMRFECVPGSSAEAEFIYEEIFVRRSYASHGLSLVTPSCAASPTVVVVDVGANIGLFSLWALHECPGCHVYAVEPSPAAFRVLERNMSASCVATGGSVAPVCVCAAARERSRVRSATTLFCFKKAPGESTTRPRERRQQRRRLREHILTERVADGVRGCAESSEIAAAAEAEAEEEEGEAVRVESRTLSELFEAWRLDHVDMLKIDVEGDELSCLQGIGARWWPKIRQVVVEVHDVHGRLERIVHLLRRQGFSVVIEAQTGGTVDGYAAVVPKTLCLHLVYAVRRDRHSSSTPL